MTIEIDKLTESELIDLSRRIVERLRFLQQLRAHRGMLEFRIGEKVCFEPEGDAPVFGVITRYNKKTVSILAEDGRNWRVSPQFLRRLKNTKELSDQGAANM